MDIVFWIVLFAIFVLVFGYCVRSSGDVTWLPTPWELVEPMLVLASVTSADYVIDLGSGDGRIVIAAAKRGAMALGIECDQGLVELARQAAAKEGVSERAAFEKADVFESDFSKATVSPYFCCPTTICNCVQKSLICSRARALSRTPLTWRTGNLTKPHISNRT